MHIVGIICEYNPFHNGHIYHLKQIKKLYPNSLIVLVLNGYFMQRGDVSVLSKQDKTRIALLNDVDLVLELPVIFGTQSADTFASKSIEILNYFKIDTLIFGSESNNLEILKEIASKQLNNPDYEIKVKKYLKQKLNYPTALAKALNINFDFNNPNDLLAISYLKALNQINSNIKPITILRTSSYHDLENNKKIISASNIRNKIKQKKEINKYLPPESLQSLQAINEDLLYKLLQYKIKTTSNLEDYLDVDEGLENRLKKYINEENNLEDYIKKIKTKRYTYNKIKRMLIHILLDFKKTDNLKNIEYLKILGFSKKGKNYLNKIKKEINISLKPIYNSQTYSLEQKAVFIYDLVTNSNQLDFELKNKPIIKD